MLKSEGFLGVRNFAPVFFKEMGLKDIGKDLCSIS